MAYDYNNYEKFYNAMNDSQRAKWNEQNKNDADFNDFLSKYNAKNQTSTPVSTGKASSQTAVPEYWGTWASNAKQSNYVNQWEGNYKYNPTTWYYEKQWTSTGTTTPTTPTQTSTTSTPSSVSTPKSDTISSMKEYWDSLDYAQQQEKLKANPSLKEWLAKYWITSKTAPVESTWTTWDTGKTWWTTPADKWDYSDNSPERMAEIADNVNRFYNTNPGIFENEDTFRKFFIDWKGRTPEQEAFLMDFYKNRKKYNELDNYTADEIWAMDVYWRVPESYLTYLKNSDPERYAAVMDAKAKEQDKIKDKTSLETTNVMTWEDDENTITSKAIEWLKKQWLFIDEDWNFIDDRTENYATDEEKQYAKDAADIIARNLDIDNTVKHTYDDLVEKYPWATKATLMAMAQDINSDLLREKENNNVELTRLQWYMDYMQSERQERNRIWENAINQLQKQYGMYYTYSPEWMSELAQAQYAATNVTLDQADNWTDTQKQMALDSVLTPIYEQYGDIIQRPKAQVINDVMAYAKNNWLTLSEALDQNFMKYLKEKPAYQQRVNASDTSNIAWTKIWEDADGNAIYWFVDTLNKTVDPYGSFWGKTWWSGYEYTANWINSNRNERVGYMSDLAGNYTDIWDMANAIANWMSWLWGWELECWVYVNDYINAVTGSKWAYGSLISEKTKNAPNRNWDDIQVWDAIVFDYNINTPQWVLNSPEKDELLKYGHVGIVTWVNDDWSITMSHTNWWVVTETVVKPWSSFYGSFAWSQHIHPSKAKSAWYNEQWSNEYVAFLNAADNPESQKKIANWLWLSVDEMREQSNRYSWAQTADSYYDVLDKINWLLDEIDTWKLPSFYERGNALSDRWFWWLTSWVNQNVADWYDANDRIVSVLWLDSLINLKGRWATFWALSDSERQAINTYATSLWKNKSEEKYKQELIRLRNTLIESSHWYLWDLSKYWQNQSYDWSAWIK